MFIYLFLCRFFFISFSFSYFTKQREEKLRAGKRQIGDDSTSSMETFARKRAADAFGAGATMSRKKMEKQARRAKRKKEKEERRRQAELEQQQQQAAAGGSATPTTKNGGGEGGPASPPGSHVVSDEDMAVLRRAKLMIQSLGLVDESSSSSVGVVEGADEEEVKQARAAAAAIEAGTGDDDGGSDGDNNSPPLPPPVHGRSRPVPRQRRPLAAAGTHRGDGHRAALPCLRRTPLQRHPPGPGRQSRAHARSTVVQEERVVAVAVDEDDPKRTALRFGTKTSPSFASTSKPAGLGLVSVLPRVALGLPLAALVSVLAPPVK